MTSFERGDRRRGPGVDMGRIHSQIDRNRTRVRELVAPRTLRGKMRSFVVSRIPITPLRHALEQTPLEGAINELRPSIIDLYNNMGDMLREGKELVDFHNAIRELVDNAETQPDNDEALRQLRDKLREKAENDLNINRNPDTEQLLEQVLEPDNPEQKKKIREKTLFEAQQVLTVSETIAQIGDNIAVNTAQTFETMNAQYALLLDIRRAVTVLHRSGQDLMEAHELRINAFNTLDGQIDILLITAKLATEVQQLAAQAQVTVEADKIQALKLRADSLREQTLGILPPKTNEAANQIEAPKPS